ncbi:hypothetical protein [Roseovarius spongiae]|uniref:hypothetical protein n=1 Tax=Roseovarius spongiae TaxID=2320272 RepID=UPI001408A363|nr:hypothetical protein [Roseovarius spongiae]
MIILMAALIGAAFGAFRAHRRKGRLPDILQYAAVHALIFALVALFAVIFLERALR